MGGGRKKFTPFGVTDPEGFTGGNRMDGKDLIDTWLTEKQLLGNASYVWHRDDLLALDTSSTDYLMGECRPLPSDNGSGYTGNFGYAHQSRVKKREGGEESYGEI